MAVGYVIDRNPDDGSSGPLQVGSTTGAANGTYVDDGLDPTQAYTYDVTPYTTADVPSPGTATGLGFGGTFDAYTGNVENFSATSPSGSGDANLTWAYQGSDGFELEEWDTGAAGTNYYWIASPSGRSYQVGGLQIGDTYDFRIRVDHADGSVSDYVGASG
jgi:hypothetical protein